MGFCPVRRKSDYPHSKANPYEGYLRRKSDLETGRFSFVKVNYSLISY